MTEFTLISLGLNLVYLALALVIIRAGLWYMNRSIGVVFRDVMDTIEKDPMACAVYFGIRLFAICYVAAALVQ